MESTPVSDVITGLNLESAKGINLDIACGPLKQEGPGWIGIDIVKHDCVDIVHDLWQFPWPIESNSVNLCACSHYLEHVPPHLFLKTMAEIHRVCRHKSQVLIAGPYGLGYRFQQDPTHYRCIVESTFGYFDPTIPRDLEADNSTKGILWSVYKPPVMHMRHFSRIPSGGDADFNAVLQVCKDSEDCEYCKKGRRT